MSKFCTNCGQPIDELSNYCHNCGKELTVNSTTIKTISNNRKNKILAGLLAIFLGSLGIHNFYLGYTGKAVAQLLITILSCFTLSAISAIWALVEAIMIFTGAISQDAEGNPLGE